jgi:hypothetical protein
VLQGGCSCLKQHNKEAAAAAAAGMSIHLAAGRSDAYGLLQENEAGARRAAASDLQLHWPCLLIADAAVGWRQLVQLACDSRSRRCALAATATPHFHTDGLTRQEAVGLALGLASRQRLATAALQQRAGVMHGCRRVHAALQQQM